MSDVDSETAGSPRAPPKDDEQIDDAGEDSDVLSDIDEGVFEEEYNPDTARVEERDYEDIAKSLKASKRKRGEGEAPPKRKTQLKKRRTVEAAADDLGDAAGGSDDENGSRRQRKSRIAGDSRRAKAKEKSPEPEVDESTLTPEERRKRALLKAMDTAAKGRSSRRRKKDEVDLEEMADEEIAALKISMENACVADNKAREEGKPAIEKLKLLPKVVAMMNRNAIQHAILDPETNFLQSLRFFLEPLNDGSLPAYNIQREIFTALLRLPVEKEALLSSGIGKVVLFYTKSKRPEPGVKRMAEKLIGEWSRPILKRTDDFRKRHIETREFDYAAAKQAQETASYGSSQAATLPSRPAGRSIFEEEIQKKLAPKNPYRTAGTGLQKTYTVAPQSTYNAPGGDYRPMGSGGLEAFRKMTQKGKKK
ncbi:uncharacterized protein PpBr36_09986 [Pyricularia pennisetigena]|uniref:uncharacterized protein n=1 Tax=Pyricularia pennisetigena TaxID=1578925 RepID=UPI00114E5552|nr:uncharacterized protein PpBr36_09986 [Pyricularia pennisetigena]TLS22187.1 hypothetical protein PpBr36_09986 [Pyricularia pennisetigena]